MPSLRSTTNTARCRRHHSSRVHLADRRVERIDDIEPADRPAGIRGPDLAHGTRRCIEPLQQKVRREVANLGFASDNGELPGEFERFAGPLDRLLHVDLRSVRLAMRSASHRDTTMRYLACLIWDGIKSRPVLQLQSFNHEAPGSQWDRENRSHPCRS